MVASTGVPVTTAAVSPATKPFVVWVRVGLAAFSNLEVLLALTVSTAGVTVKAQGGDGDGQVRLSTNEPLQMEAISSSLGDELAGPADEQQSASKARPGSATALPGGGKKVVLWVETELARRGNPELRRTHRDG